MTGSSGALLRWLAAGVALCAILVIPVARDASQGWLFPDGTSYLDMASGALHESPAVLFQNAYWSPAYPALLALMMAVARPGLAGELHAVYILNWLIFLVATVCICSVSRLRRTKRVDFTPVAIFQPGARLTRSSLAAASAQ